MKKYVLIILVVVMLSTGCTQNEKGINSDSLINQGISINSIDDKTYTFETTSKEDDSNIKGKLTFIKEDVENDEKHEDKEGYSWKRISATLIFDDEKALLQGYNYNSLITDYFNPTKFYENQNEQEDGYISSIIVKDEIDMDMKYKFIQEDRKTITDENDNKSLSSTFIWEIQIPDDYNGIVVGFINGKFIFDEGMNLMELYDSNDFHLFRFN